MKEFLVFMIVFFATIVGDVICYDLAKWPERMRYGQWIFSGYVALYKVGRNKEPKP